MSFRDVISLLIFYLDDLSISDSEIFWFHTMIEFWSVSPFHSVSNCFTYFGGPWLEVYILISVMSSWSLWIVPQYLSILFLFRSLFHPILVPLFPLFSECHLLGISFPSFHFESIFVFGAEICLLNVAYSWVLFCDPFCNSVPLYW